MSESEENESKSETPENPFEQLQRQLQDLFRHANLTVVPGKAEYFTETKGPKTPPPPEESEEDERGRVLEAIRRFHLKPRDVKDYLDRFVIRQDEPKRAMAVAVCDHYNHVRRCLEDAESAERPYAKQNVILLGPTGVGKTYLIRTLARLIGVPFVKADATKFSETGYVGYDVDDMVRDLVKAANGDTELAQYGIIFIDEIDKIAASGNTGGKDVSGRGVQINLLKLMEETDVNLISQTDIMGQMQAMMEMQRGGKPGRRSLSTRHVLFIVSGAFTPLPEIIKKRMNTHTIGFGNGGFAQEKPEAELLKYAQTQDFVKFGFEPEFIGRLPVRVSFDTLEEEDLVRILEQAEENILCKYMEDFEGYGIKAHFRPEALRAVARRAADEKTGARALMTVLERGLRDYKFELPSTAVKELEITAEMIETPGIHLADLLEANRDSRRGLLLGDVAAFALRFEEQHGVRLDVETDAADAIADLAEAENKTVHTVCERIFRDLPYAVKLITKHSGENHFTLSKSIVADPNQALSQLVLATYQHPEAAAE